MENQWVDEFELTRRQPFPDPVQANAADPKVTLFTARFTAWITSALFIIDQRQNSFDVSRGILVGVPGVPTIRKRDGFTNYNTRSYGSGLETDVEIIEKQIRRASLGASQFFQSRFPKHDEAIG